VCVCQSGYTVGNIYQGWGGAECDGPGVGRIGEGEQLMGGGGRGVCPRYLYHIMDMMREGGGG